MSWTSAAKACIFLSPHMARLNVVPFPIEVKSKVKGSGQECPLHTGNYLPHLRNFLLQQRASVAVGFFFGSQDYGGGDAVAGFHVEEADALGVAAGFADGF
jgi:hypothetical protein